MNEFKKMRLELGMNMADAAKFTGYSRMTIYRAETGGSLREDVEFTIRKKYTNQLKKMEESND